MESTKILPWAHDTCIKKKDNHWSTVNYRGKTEHKCPSIEEWKTDLINRCHIYLDILLHLFNKQCLRQVLRNSADINLFRQLWITEDAPDTVPFKRELVTFEQNVLKTQIFEHCTQLFLKKQHCIFIYCFT